MSFQPQIPLAGISGWRLFQRTQATQQAAFERSPQLQRDIAYFEQNIGKVKTAEELVSDRRLLQVALGAFGLESEISKKAFVRKILEGGTEEPTALANRMTAAGIKDFAQTFGFGNAGGSQTGTPGFAARIVDAYKTRQFEAAVGASNNDVRLAMNFKREMQALSAGTEGGSWFTVLASKPLRAVVEKAYNLPTSFGKLDVDRQRSILIEKTRQEFGSEKLTAFADPANVDKMINRFLARSQAEGGGPSANVGQSAALSILRGAAGGSSAGLYNLLLSRT
jgi:hypothetical protein